MYSEIKKNSYPLKLDEVYSRYEIPLVHSEYLEDDLYSISTEKVCRINYRLCMNLNRSTVCALAFVAKSTLFLCITLSLGCGSADENREFIPSGGSSTATQDEETETQPETVAPPATATPKPAPTPAVSTKVVSRFLWKPDSERNGNLVILASPTGLQVRVTGDISELLANTGPSNGYGTTARGSFPGCSYGKSIIVEFFDTAGKRVLIAGGGSSISVPDGCNRATFSG